MNNESCSNNGLLISSSLKIISALAGCFMFTVLVVSALPFITSLTSAIDANGSMRVPVMLIALGLAFSGFLIRRSFLKHESATELQQFLSAYLKSTMITFAMFELIAILGFISWLSYGDKSVALILGITALVCMILNWPRQSDFSKLPDSMPPEAE